MKRLKRLIYAGMAAAALFTGIHATGVQAQVGEMQEERKDISECTFENSLGAYGSIAILPSERYTGNEIHPEIIIKDGDYTLIEGTDYDVSPYYLADNVNANATPWYSFEHDYGEDCPQVVVYGNGRYKGLKQMIFAILSENQKETEGHLIYSDKAVLAGYDGVTIDGYVGAETEVEIPLYIDGKPVQEINKKAFAYNPTLEKADISDNVFRIMDGAFCHCGNLREVKLSRQLWGISNSGFAECTSLKELSLPASLKKLGLDVFVGCTSLEAFHSQSEEVYDVDGVLFIKYGGLNGKMKSLEFYPPAKEADIYNIPNGTEEIHLRAFWGAGGVKNLIIPSSVEFMYNGKYGSLYGMASPVNIVFKHDAPSGILKADLFYDLPAGSTVTVKNEEMKEAAEAAVSEQCRGNVTVRIARNASEGFELARNAFILSKGEQAQLSWTMIPADTTESVTWRSQDPAVAEVDPVNGMITAKGYGKCTITGTDESGHAQNVDVFVYDACTMRTFMLDCSGYGRTFKEDERYPACVLPEMADGRKEGSFAPGVMTTAVAFANGYAGDMPVRFENSAQDVVEIASRIDTYRTGTPTEDGGYTCQDNKYTRLYLEYLKPGTATITAVFDDNGKEIRESITVHVGHPGGEPGSGNPGDGNIQDPGNQDGKQDQEIQCPKSIKKAYGSKPFSLNVRRKKGDGRLTYASSNPKVVKVENGRATIRGTGRTVITVTAGETANYRKKTVKVTVDVTPKKQKAGVKAAGKRKLQVRWKKDARATGYEVQHSTDRKFRKGIKGASVKKKGISAKTLASLKKGKTYYVRVRAYKSVKSGGRTIKLYGPWSSTAKSRKVK